MRSQNYGGQKYDCLYAMEQISAQSFNMLEELCQAGIKMPAKERNLNKTVNTMA